MLIGGTIGWFLTLPGFAVVAISIVEGVICLTKSKVEFDKHIYQAVSIGYDS